MGSTGENVNCLSCILYGMPRGAKEHSQKGVVIVFVLFVCGLFNCEFRTLEYIASNGKIIIV